VAPAPQSALERVREDGRHAREAEFAERVIEFDSILLD
jgi:hypothetical protein